MYNFQAKTILLSVSLTALLYGPAVSAEYFPELDNNKYSDLPEYDRRLKIADDLTLDAQKLEKSAQYAEALQIINRAIKIGERHNLQRSLLRVQLLRRLNRSQEANHTLRELFESHISEQGVWEPYINNLIASKQTAAAVNASKRIHDYRWTEESSWLLARSLDAAGQEGEAIQIAKSEWYHLAHLGLPCEKLKSFLTTKGLGPADLTRITTLNDAVIAKIKVVCETKTYPSPDLIRLWFPKAAANPRTFEIGYSDRTGPGFTFVSPGGILWMDDCNNCSILALHVDTDKVSLLADDLEKIFGKGIAAVSHESAHSPGFPSLTYRSNNPELRFAFARDGIHPLTEVRFGWAISPAQIPRVEKLKPKTLVEVDAKLDDAKKELDAGAYRKAAKIIMECWEDAYADRDRSAWYAQIQRKRELLAKAYDGLKQPEVAEFLRVAPMETIRTENIVSEYGRLPLPKIDDYKQARWTVLCEQEGEYKIVYDKYNPPTVLSPASRFYKDFSHYFGPMKVWSDRKIAPLPLVLVEKMDKHIFNVP